MNYKYMKPNFDCTILVLSSDTYQPILKIWDFYHKKNWKCPYKVITISNEKRYKSKDIVSEGSTKDEYIKENSVHWQSFPESDDSLVASQAVVVVVQVNGKRRAEMLVDRKEFDNGDGKDAMIEKAKRHEQIAKWVMDKSIKKTIWVAPVGKRQGLVNFVVG